MRKIKILFLVMVLIFSINILAGCASTKEEVTVKIATLSGPTGMGMVKLMEDSEDDDSLNYEFTTYGAPDELSGKVIGGEVDIAALPTNMASVIYNKTEGDIKLAAINTLGVLYVIENGDEINSIEDLEGKDIGVSGKGATPDFVLDFLLRDKGLDPETDLNIDFSMQHADLSAALAEGDVSIGLLPEPHVTSTLLKNDELRVALDLTEEWESVLGKDSSLPMGCIVVSKEFAEKNGKDLDKFLEKYQESVNWVNQNTEEAGELIEKHGILPKAKLAEQAITKSNIVFISGDDAVKPVESFLEVLMDLNPASIGGKLPDEAFYYKK